MAERSPAGPVPEEALAYFRDKSLRPGFSYLDVWRQEHTYAFTVAKLMEEELLGTVQDSLETALADGVPFKQWAKDIRSTFDQSGWSDYSHSEDNTLARLNRIYETNMRVARAAGQWDRVQKTKSVLPNLEYVLGPSEHHREEHAAWEGVILPADDPWWDEHYPPNGYGCFLPGTKISGVVLGASKAIYAGPAVELQLASGARLAVTVNHPIATAQGWIAAGEVREGSYCLSHQSEVELATRLAVADEQAPTCVEDVFEALAAHGGAAVQVAPLNFHGEARSFVGEVQVVGSYGGLRIESRQEFCEPRLAPAQLAVQLAAPGHRTALGKAVLSTSSYVGRSAQRATLLAGELGHTHQGRFGSASRFEALPSKESGEGAAAYADFMAELQHRSAGQIALDQVVAVRRFPFSGHVFDLESSRGWIFAQGVIAGNCKCGVIQTAVEADEAAPDDGTYEWTNPKTGDSEELPVGVDPGWDHNPGAERARGLREAEET